MTAHIGCSTKLYVGRIEIKKKVSMEICDDSVWKRASTAY